MTAKRVWNRWVSRVGVIAVALVTLWTINAELIHLGGITLKNLDETRLDLTLTLDDLGAAAWQVGSINLKDDQGTYQVSVVNDAAEELFKLRLNAGTGELIKKKAGRAAERLIPVDEIRDRVVTLLPQLVVGEVTKQADRPFALAILLYDGRKIARVKVDPLTGRPFDPLLVAKERGASNMRAKWIPGGLVTPLGWAGGGLSVLGTLYFVWRRSLLAQLMVPDAQASPVNQALQRTLSMHCWMSFVAAALIVIHTANDWSRLTWNISWLAFTLIVIVTGSGMLGRMLLDRGAPMANWRRFHRPVVTILFVVMVFHVIQKLEFASM